MNRSQLSSAQTFSILAGAAVMVSLAMGMRQSLGLFQPQMIRDIGVTAAQFSLAIAIQNIVWGLTQPFMGMAADRWGARPVAVAGVLTYAACIGLAIVAQSAWVLTLGIGLCIGLALSCTASNIAMSVTSRTVRPARRSVAMGALAGGICSTSTTLFNAAMRFGLEIGERTAHYYYIDRYPLGLDATVSITGGGRQTMSFRNDTKGIIFIRGSRIRSGNGPARRLVIA